MGSPPKHLVVVAGEASGDMHAAHLIETLKRIAPSITFSGLGGPKMRAAGVDLYEDLTKMAVVGFWEVIKHYKDIKKAFDLILKKIDETSVDAVILVDYPGFNLRLAKELKKRSIKVIYYISPQIWAWKQKRVHFIKKNVDKMLVLFQFEKDLYADFGIDVEFIGHPLIDTIRIHGAKESFLLSNNLSPEKLTIGILPGSREKEIENLLPVMLDAAKRLSGEFPQIQFLIIKAPTIAQSSIEQYLQSDSLTCQIIDDNIHDSLNACDLCMVASGTATLETAILQKPMVVVYKTSLLTWILAKLFVKIADIGLVNVVAGRRIVPECVQFQATGRRIAAELKNIFTDELKIADMKTNLRAVKESLGPGGASLRAAGEVLKTLNS
ncbi:MAG: lipid-A-disaccharide synthase [Candidatus Omnitrophica bacterium]|nr:lipid-A-disaccharide synthase [Candidatus Omnitrophota bacterium]